MTKRTPCSNTGLALGIRRRAPSTDIVCRSLDHMPFFIDDKVKGAVGVNERQSIPSGVLTYTALAHARDFSIAHQRLDERRLDPKNGSDDISIDGKSALFELNRVHQLARSRTRPSGHVWPLRSID
jgi:hypothetical protein